MRDPSLEAFGSRIRSIRKAKGYSQEQMAGIAGLDRGYMGHIERGEKNITLLKIYQLKDALDITFTELFKDQ
jgi:transcriptional regulator with XRE-family HTH domain